MLMEVCLGRHLKYQYQVLTRGDMVMKVKTLNKFLLVIIILYQLVILVDKVKDVIQVVIQG